MKVREVVQALEALAPLSLAEEWDNVGLLVGDDDAPVERVLLTIDLTDGVLAEALEHGAQMIVAYHPVLFDPVRRLTTAQPTTRIVLAAARSGLAIHSPHTALDAASHGVAEWLAEGLGPADVAPLTTVDAERDTPGPGRLVTLKEPADLKELASRVQAHLGARRLLVAPAPQPPGRHSVIGLCPGAGAALVPPALAKGATVFLTGEMRHHDVLAAQAEGCSLLLAGHTNTERGYLPRLAGRLASALPDLEVVIAKRDRDPLEPMT
jgi:dinuclear metal center YbgI/SA1388 family protein